MENNIYLAALSISESMTVSEKEIVKETEGNECGQIEVGLTYRNLRERAEKIP